YENYSIRTGLNAELTDTFSVLLRYSHGEQDDPSTLVFTPGATNGKVICTACYLPGAIFSTAPFTVSAGEKIARRFKNDAYQITGTWNLGFATLSSYTQWRKDNTTESKYSGDYTNL